MTTLCCRKDVGTPLLLFGAFISLLLVLARPSEAEDRPRSQEYEFDIPRTTRVMALYELSRQAGGLLLGYLSTSTAEDEALVGPVKGRLTVEQVLSVVLRSSLLTSRWVDDSMVSVEPKLLSEDPSELNTEGVLRTLPHSSEFDPSQVAMPEEVMVLGWPIRDLALSGQPVVVVERSDLDAMGASSLPDMLKYISQSAYARPESYRQSGAQYAEMRGLGPDTALILINGRRALPSANSITSSAFDLNTIPVSAVERIEFLLDSASAPYGTDAVGGIINIILRDRIATPTMEFRYSWADGGAEEQRYTVAAGLNRDDIHGTVLFDYFKTDGLLGEERDLWRNQNFSRFGGSDLRSPLSSPGNVMALDGNLPGLNAPMAAVPSSDNDDFRAADQTSELNLESVLRFYSIVPESVRKTAAATGSVRLASSITASAEMLYVDRESTYHYIPPALVGLAGASLPIPGMPTNPHNPFGVPVLVTRLLTEYPTQYRTFESDLLRWVLAVHGDWRSWNWEVSAMRSDEQLTTWDGNAIDMSAAALALANPNPTTNPDSMLNPFTSGPVGNETLLDSLRAPRYEDRFSSGGQQFAGFVQGPLGSWRAGTVTAALGVEWRNESMNSLDKEAGSLDATASFDTDRDVKSGFAQLRVPLISERMTRKFPAVRELTLTAGARWDEYSDFGSDWHFQGALLWKPQSDFNVRVSASESYRPPSLYDLHLPRVATTATVVDPVRNELATIDYITGGNPDLHAATATSLTAGVLYSPVTPNNWSISADWWRIDMDDRQVLVPLQLMLSNEAFFTGSIKRDPSTQVLRSVDASRMNGGAVSASGVDLVVKADMLSELGRFTPGLQLTWFDRYQITDVPGQSREDRVNLANEAGSILEWRAVASLKWRRGPFGAVMFARYTPRYDDAIGGMQTGRKIAAQTLIDMQASLDVGMLSRDKSRLDGLKLWAGAFNVFNEEPGFADVGAGQGFDSSQAELKKRVFYVRLEQKF